MSVNSDLRRPRSAKRGTGGLLLLPGVVVCLVASAAGWGSLNALGTGSLQRLGTPLQVGVDFVQVDVSVTDADGRFVRGLDLADFELYEDGQRQQISLLSLIDVPVEGRPQSSSTTVSRLEPDVRSNAEDSAGRVYVILLDDLHVHPMRSPRVKEAAREFVRSQLGPNDLAAVLHTSGRPGASQEFTTRQSLLLRAVDKFVGRKIRSSVLERLDEYQRRGDQPGNADLRLNRIIDPLDTQRADQARGMLRTLTNLSDLLAGAGGRRKAVLLISEGIDYPLQETMTQTSSGVSTFTHPYASDVRHYLQQAIRAAARANVSVYALDPRGMAGTGGDTIEVSSFPDNPLLGLMPGAFQEELRQAQDSLRVLADLTGGVASLTSNDLDKAFGPMVRANSTYYMLGYRSNDKRHDERFRTIDVQVRRPGVRVRARSGYAARPRGKAEPGPLTAVLEPSARLRSLLNAPLPAGPLPLRLFAAPFRGAKEASVSVVVEIDARSIRLSAKNGFYTGKVEMAVVAYDAGGKFTTGDRQVVELQLKPETYQAVETHGLRLLFRLNLSPGHFQLRAAAHDAGTGATGSVFHDLEIPDFNADPVALSGLILTSDRAGKTPTARIDPAFHGILPSPPSSRRTFYSSDTLIALLELYRTAQATGAAIELVTTVRDSVGRIWFKGTEPVPADGRESNVATAGAFGYAVAVPLTELSAGSYILKVEALTRTTRDRPIAREVPFEISARAAVAR